MVRVVPHIYLFLLPLPQEILCEILKIDAAHLDFDAALAHGLRPCRAHHHQAQVLRRGRLAEHAHPHGVYVLADVFPVRCHGAAVRLHVEESADQRIDRLDELRVRGHTAFFQHLFQAFGLFRHIAARVRRPQAAELAFYVQELPFHRLCLCVFRQRRVESDAQMLHDGGRAVGLGLRVLFAVPAPSYVPGTEVAAVVRQDVFRDAAFQDAAPQRQQHRVCAGRFRDVPSGENTAARVDERR